ncbi:MAG TPA: START domain-containing protein [Puia sp.]|nr:START domain-containing protein [Puia sp.]
MKALYVCLLALPSFLPAPDKNEWTLRREKDGINIYSRPSDYSKFNDIRVDMDLPGTIDQLASILRDVNRYTDWIYATRTAKMIRKVSDNEFIYYAEVGTPWPAANRDYYADMKITFNPANRSMSVFSSGMKDYQPEKKDLVRIPMSKGSWTVTTQSDKKIHLQYILEIDPGGAVPAWILNSFATKAPIETFSNLKRKMEELNR